MLTKHSSDEDLWVAIVNDDSDAFAMLFKRYWKQLYVTAYAHLKDNEVCESVVQDIFVYLWEKRKQLTIASFEKYLNASARYGVYKQLKVARLSPVDYWAPSDIIENGYTHNDGEQNLSAVELLQDVGICLGVLPNRCREIFILSRVNQLSNNEIAEKLHISKRTVENQISHALKHLKTSLKYSGILLLTLTFVLGSFIVNHRS